MELVPKPSIKLEGDEGVARVEVTTVTTLGPSWMNPIIDFLVNDRIPDDEKEANKIRKVAARYWLSKDRKLIRGTVSFVLTPRESRPTLDRAV